LGTDIDFRLAVSELERARPDLVGLYVRDVPSLGDWRKKFRPGWTRLSAIHFFAAVFNVVVASASLVPWAWLNAACAAVSTGGLIFCESRYRATTRQLNRLATVQLVRDRWGLRD